MLFTVVVLMMMAMVTDCRSVSLVFVLASSLLSCASSLLI